MEFRLALWLLGPPRIELDGSPVKLDRRKAIALLAYLAATGEHHRRDALVNLLWPDCDTARGRSALRRTLYTVRKALGAEFLDVDRSTAGLLPDDDLWVDVVQFRQHLAECETHGHPAPEVCSECVAPLTEAAALHRGDFLSGFGLKDSYNFDDWQLLESESLRRELAEVLDRLVHWHIAQREFEPALGFARRRLALDPLDEPTHRTLMRLYAWSGRRPAALRQYEECAAILLEQLGVPPQEATTELYTAIQEGQALPLPDEEGAAPSSESSRSDLPSWAGSRTEPGGEPPAFLEGEVPVERPLFVAREHELAQLDLHLTAALAGQGRVAFVTGDAGSGKTALLQAFARHAQDAHPDLVSTGGHGNAQTGVGDPYLPFREILGLLTGDIQAQWAAGAMTREQARRLWRVLPVTAQALVETGPDLLDTFVPGSALLKRVAAYGSGRPAWLTRLEERAERSTDTRPPTSGPQQGDLFEQYSRVLQALAQRGPLLLVVDDLQWADLGSISLLFHLGRQLAGCRILIVGAYRPEEVALGRPDPAADPGQRERHPLEPVVHEFQREFGKISVDLGRAGTQEFVEALLDSEPNRLGDAFREMLFRQTRGHPLFTVELLRGLQEQGDLVQDPEGRWVEGAQLDWEALPARVEAVIAERIDRVAQPLRAALEVASVEGETFTAEVVARVQQASEREVVGHLSRDLDRRHRLVRAQGIQRLDGQRLSQYRFRHTLFQKYLYGSLDEVEKAYLHEAVGNTLESLYEGKSDTMAVIAGQLAWHFQEAGIVDKAIHYLHRAGDRALQLSAYQEARTHLTAALDLLMALPDSHERAQRELALQLCLGMAWMGTAPPEVEKAFNRARELCQQTGQTSELYHILGQLSTMHYVGAEHQRGRELAEETLALAEQAGDPLLVAVSHWRLGYLLLALGEYPASRAHLEQMIAFYEPRHHQPLVFLSASNGGLSALAYDACCLWALGYPEQGLKRSEEALALARELDHPFSLADVLTYGGCLFSRMRQDAYALKDNSEKLLQLVSERDIPNWLALAITFRGEALAMLGQIEEGIAQIREGHAVQDAMGVHCYLAVGLAAVAEAQAKAGHPEQGLATLDEALALVEKTDERHWEAELYRLQGELLLMQGKDAEAEASLHRAIRVARRQSAKSWELRATTGLARLWQEQGKGEEAHDMLAEIYGWFTEGFDTPDLVEARALLDELLGA